MANLRLKAAPLGAAENLGPFLEGLFARYHRPQFIGSDPIQFVHRYQAAEDQEVVGLLSALLAFGNVKAVERSLDLLLPVLGDHPARALAQGSLAPLRRELAPFRHRWISGEDMAALLEAMAAVLGDKGSFGALVRQSYAAQGSLEGVLNDFTLALRGRFPRRGAASRGLVFLLAAPSQGSACKRLAMYFRWMVRRDEIDLGLWRGFLPRSALRIPLDTHLSRIVRYLGLTARQTVGWKMAEEVTGELARIDPEDPVRFDFALARLGILRECSHRLIPEKCAPCPIRPVCRLGSDGTGTQAVPIRTATL